MVRDLWRLWRCWRRGGLPLARRLHAAHLFDGRVYQSPWEMVPQNNRGWRLESEAFHQGVPDGPQVGTWTSRAALAVLGIAVLALVPWKVLVAVPFLFGMATGTDTLTSAGTPNWTDVTGGAYSRTFFAGAARYTGTREQRITTCNAEAAAFAAASPGPVYNLVPGSMLPYSAPLVTFNNAVRMIAEGFNPNEYNVKAYGAKGDAVQDDTTAILAASNAALNAPASLQPRGGNVVRFPAGNYAHGSTLQVPVTTAVGVNWKGDGLRSTYLFPTGPSTNFSLNSDGDRVVLVFGTLSPDNVPSQTNITQYCGMEDMSQSGSLITSGSVVGCQFTEMQYGWMRNCNIEGFPNSSIGLYLRGATVTAGLGQNAGPHVRLCNFINVGVLNIGSSNGSPVALLLANADENSFFNCTSAVSAGLAPGSRLAKANWIQIGRNNRFYGCLGEGDLTANKTNYAGYQIGPPQNRAGTPQGALNMNIVYGDVIEGFDVGFWVARDDTGNTRGNSAHGINTPSCNTPYADDNVSASGASQSGTPLGTSVFMPLNTPPLNYFDGPWPTGAAQTLTVNSATPSVAGGNVFYCANSSPTTITSFTGTINNHFFWVRLDANTTIRDQNNGGGGDIRCWGRRDIVGQLLSWVLFMRSGSSGFTEQITVPHTIDNSSANALSIPVPVKSPMGPSTAGSLARVAQTAFQDAGKTTAATSDASITSYNLPAGVLGTTAQKVRITARGRQATQAGSFNIKFGATVLGTVAPGVGESWSYTVTVTRTGAATQLANGETLHAATPAAISAQPAETLSGAVLIDFRGSVTSGGTLSVDEAMVEYLSS